MFRIISKGRLRKLSVHQRNRICIICGLSRCSGCSDRCGWSLLYSKWQVGGKIYSTTNYIKNRYGQKLSAYVITTSRQSGLSDTEWCRRNDIPTRTFENAVSRLRKHACELPLPLKASTVTDRTLDLTNGKPDVVQIAIEPDKLPTAIQHPMDAVSALHLDNSHTIEIMIGNTSVGISNQASLELVHEVISSLKEISC